LQRKIKKNKSAGKTIADNMPIFKLSLARNDTNPMSVGPVAHPMSPARANSAKIGVPPRGSNAVDVLKVPGQSILTERPVPTSH